MMQRLNDLAQALRRAMMAVDGAVVVVVDEADAAVVLADGQVLARVEDGTSHLVYVVEVGEDARETYRGRSLMEAARAAAGAFALLRIDQALDAFADEQMAAAWDAEQDDQACWAAEFRDLRDADHGVREATSVAADLAFDAARERRYR